MIQLQIETIAICNAACVFCPYPDMNRQRGTMRMDLFEKIIKEAKEHSLISLLTLTGLGEPLLDKHLDARLEFVRKHLPAIPLSLFSNGTYLDAQKADLLRKHRVKVYVSLNASNAEKRRQIMQLDDYDRVVGQIRYAQSIGCDVVIKAVKEKDLMEGEETELFMSMWEDKAFLNMEGNWAGRMSIPRTSQVTPCSRALLQIMVLWDGRVVLCCFDSEGEVTFGDLNTQSIQEVFNSELATKYRQYHTEGRRQELKLCNVCTAI